MTVGRTSPAAKEALGHIITFYSYKGGTGRSMALANMAWILALQGHRVLVIDWDLEAPGVYRFFHPFLADKELVSTEGLIDMVERLAAHAATRHGPSAAGEEVDIINYVEPLEWPRESTYSISWKQFGPRAGIDFMPAGRQGRAYSLKLSAFNWVDFYERLGGRQLLDRAKEQMRSIYDYVLIDSRTGVSDTSGICTVEMPDTLVICFTLNNQSIRGAAGAAESIRQQRHGGEKSTRPTDQFRIFPVPTRVEVTSEKDKREAALDLAKKTFAPYLSHMPRDAQNAYWGAVQNAYVPYYAFEEIPAVFADDPHEALSLTAAIKHLTRAITDRPVGSLPLLASDPNMDDKVRKEIVRWFLRPAPQTDAVQAAQQIYEGFDAPSKLAMKRMVLRLVGIDPNANATAKSAAWDEIVETDAWMTETLVDRRLLAIGGSEGARTVRFQDPVVVEKWEMLRQWVDEDRHFLTWRAGLAGSIQSWTISGSDDNALLRGKLLEEAAEWLRSRRSDLNQAEQEYIDACVTAADRVKREEQLAAAAAADARARVAQLERLLGQQGSGLSQDADLAARVRELEAEAKRQAVVDQMVTLLHGAATAQSNRGALVVTLGFVAMMSLWVLEIEPGVKSANDAIRSSQVELAEVQSARNKLARRERLLDANLKSPPPAINRNVRRGPNIRSVRQQIVWFSGTENSVTTFTLGPFRVSPELMIALGTGIGSLMILGLISFVFVLRRVLMCSVRDVVRHLSGRSDVQVHDMRETLTSLDAADPLVRKWRSLTVTVADPLGRSVLNTEPVLLVSTAVIVLVLILIRLSVLGGTLWSFGWPYKCVLLCIYASTLAAVCVALIYAFGDRVSGALRPRMGRSES